MCMCACALMRVHKGRELCECPSCPCNAVHALAINKYDENNDVIFCCHVPSLPAPALACQQTKLAGSLDAEVQTAR